MSRSQKDQIDKRIIVRAKGSQRKKSSHTKQTRMLYLRNFATCMLELATQQRCQLLAGVCISFDGWQSRSINKNCSLQFTIAQKKSHTDSQPTNASNTHTVRLPGRCVVMAKDSLRAATDRIEVWVSSFPGRLPEPVTRTRYGREDIHVWVRTDR